jgi:L-iditol 2-dehydrogenase
MNMRAARLYGKNDLRVEDIPVPGIEDDEILVRVKAAALCGTDYRMYSNGAPNVDENNPLVLCHEFAGVIEKTGSRVCSYKAGQRVSVAPNIGCGVCGFCVSGNGHHCTSLIALGVHMDGGFAEFVKVPASAVSLGNVSVLDDNVSFEAAAANEAFACVYNAYERYNVFPGDVVLIIGAGAIGLMHAGLAKMSGASKIIISDISQSRLDECEKLEPSLITVKRNLLKRVMEETDGKGANVVITACSVASVQQDALTYAAIDGRVNFFGGLPKGKEKVLLDTNIIHYKQLILTGTTRSSLWHYRKTLDFIASGIVDIDPLITHRYKLNDIKTALDNLANAVGLKHVIVF